MSLKSSLRSILYRSEKGMQRARFGNQSQDLPTLLGISFPKSGTHLLDQILLGFSNVAPYAKRLHSFYAEYEGESGLKRAPEQALHWLDSFGANGGRDVASAHLFARPDAVARVCSPNFVPYFIYRDPRDVVVSHVFYVTEMESRHVHHAYYQSLPDFDARLKASIVGRQDPSTGSGQARFEFPNIAERFAPYMDWLNQPEVLAIHFESLINARVQTLNRIIDHFLVRVPLHILSPQGAGRQLILESLESAINPTKSPTFRSGRTGEWKKHFTDEHKEIFKEVAGDLLIKLGFETNLQW